MGCKRAPNATSQNCSALNVSVIRESVRLFQRMMTLLDFAVVGYALVGLGLMAQGLRYLLAGQFEHYHAEVIKERWSQLPHAEQRLLLGLLKGFGAGMFCVGVAMVFVATEPFRRGAFLAQWFLAVMSITYTSMLVKITQTALLPGAAPILVTKTMVVICVLATVASFAR